MTDYMGNEINIGDNVVYIQFDNRSANFRKGVVVGTTEKMIKVESESKYGKEYGNDMRSVSNVKVIKI